MTVATGVAHSEPMSTDATSPEARLQAIGLTIPPAPTSVASYLGVSIVGNLAFTAGHGPVVNGKLAHIGRLGENMDVDAGRVSAQTVALNMLATLKAELGDLGRVERVIKVIVMVNSAPDFEDQPLVADAATEVFIGAFGRDRGMSARSAVGMASLPFGISVEIEGVFQVA